MRCQLSCESVKVSAISGFERVPVNRDLVGRAVVLFASLALEVVFVIVGADADRAQPGEVNADGATKLASFAHKQFDEVEISVRDLLHLDKVWTGDAIRNGDVFNLQLVLIVQVINE